MGYVPLVMKIVTNARVTVDAESTTNSKMSPDVTVVVHTVNV